MADNPDLRDELLARYRELQGAGSSGALYQDPTLLWSHFDVNYAPRLVQFSEAAAVAEIGSGSGGLLGWLRSRGFDKIQGVDQSPEDVRFANEYLGDELVLEGDAIGFLRDRAGAFDLVVAKAIVEHVAKDQLVELIDSLRVALRPGGLVLVEVPNMDWLLASHERYMDLTHEVGFTRESLATWLGLRLVEVDVRGSVQAAPTRSQRLLRRPLVAATRRALYVLGEGASDLLFEHRSLVATARRPAR